MCLKKIAPSLPPSLLYLVQKLPSFSCFLPLHQAHRARTQQPTKEIEAFDSLVETYDIQLTQHL
eukprot:evm.model.NODE_43157_length_4442_cov_5.384962.1